MLAEAATFVSQLSACVPPFTEEDLPFFIKCQQHVRRTASHLTRQQRAPSQQASPLLWVIPFSSFWNKFWYLQEAWFLFSMFLCHRLRKIITSTISGPSLFTGWAQHCVFVRCCVCSEHFNNSIWQCPQVKDMPRTPQTRSMSFSDLWEFSLWRAFVNTFLVMVGWLGLDVDFKCVLCWPLKADRPELNQNVVRFLQRV